MNINKILTLALTICYSFNIFSQSTFLDSIEFHRFSACNKVVNSLENFSLNGDLLLAEKFEVYNSDWEERDSTQYFYNDLEQLFKSNLYEIANGEWEKVKVEKRTYDNDGNIETILTEEKVNSVWEFQTKISYDYDSLGNQIKYLRQTWNDSIWINSIKIEYEYLDTFNVDFSISYIWFNENWRTLLKNEYEYDSLGNQVFQIFLSYMDSMWNEENRTFNEFDSLQNLVFSLSQYKEDTVWQNNYQRIFKFNSENLVDTHYYQNFSDTIAINFRQFVYNYNSNNLLVSRFRNRWNGYNYSPYFLYLNEYDDNINRVLYTTLERSGAVWDTIQHSKYYYGEYTSNSNKLLSKYNYQLYPNPVDEILQINFFNDQYQKLKISIFDTTGKTVYVNNKLEISNSINVQKLPKGSLFVIIFDSKNYEVIPIIKL